MSPLLFSISHTLTISDFERLHSFILHTSPFYSSHFTTQHAHFWLFIYVVHPLFHTTYPNNISSLVLRGLLCQKGSKCRIFFIGEKITCRKTMSLQAREPLSKLGVCMYYRYSMVKFVKTLRAFFSAFSFSKNTFF